MDFLGSEIQSGVSHDSLYIRGRIEYHCSSLKPVLCLLCEHIFIFPCELNSEVSEGSRDLIDI